MTGSVTIHLVRHGESLWNAERRYQGQQDSGLTSYGRDQAARFGESFAREVPRPDVVVSSDLPRVTHTAQPYVARVGATVSYSPALREMSVGDWAGMTLEEAAQRHPDVVAAVAAGQDLPRGGGETFGETRERVVDAIEQVVAGLEADDADRVGVVFTSGNPIRLAAAHALGVPSPGHMVLGAPDNCSITTLRFEGARRAVLRYNHDIAPARAADQREIS